MCHSMPSLYPRGTPLKPLAERPFVYLRLLGAACSRDIKANARRTNLYFCRWKVSSAEFQSRCMPACTVSREVGNCYTASVFVGLISVLASLDITEEDINKRVLMFSYGSGFVATAYRYFSAPNHRLARVRGRINVKCEVFAHSHAR